MAHLVKACAERSRFVVFIERWAICEPLRDQGDYADLVSVRGRRDAEQESDPGQGPSSREHGELLGLLEGGGRVHPDRHRLDVARIAEAVGDV